MCRLTATVAAITVAGIASISGLATARDMVAGYFKDARLGYDFFHFAV